MKLDLAAVEATDCAIEGTVNCASRDEGRPAFGGTMAALDTDETAGTAVGADTAFTTGFATSLAIGFPAVATSTALASVLPLATGATEAFAGLAFSSFLSAGLETGLAAALAAGLAVVLAAVSAADFGGGWRAGFTFLAAAFGVDFRFWIVTAGFKGALRTPSFTPLTEGLATGLTIAFVVALTPGLWDAWALALASIFPVDGAPGFTGDFFTDFTAAFFAEFAAATVFAGLL